MSNVKEKTVIPPRRRFIAERVTGSSPDLPKAFLAIAQILTDWQPIAPLCYAGNPPYPIDLTESAIGSYLAEVQQAWAQNIPKVFCLANYADLRRDDQTDTLQLTLFYDVEPTPLGDIEYIWFSLPGTSHELEHFAAMLQFNQLVQVIGAICQGFGAYHGYVEDEQLLLLYRSTRAAERARAALPPELQQFVPKPVIPANVAENLPQLLVPQEFDRRFVPDAIWWINFWDYAQVETIGQEQIRSENWAQIIEQPGGALLLIATLDPPNVADASDMARLDQITERLNLRELQERYRYR